jgi:hypothetical protein
MTLTEAAPGAGLWLSKDSGRTWQPFEDLSFANIQRVVAFPCPAVLRLIGFQGLLAGMDLSVFSHYSKH